MTGKLATAMAAALLSATTVFGDMWSDFVNPPDATNVVPYAMYWIGDNPPPVEIEESGGVVTRKEAIADAVDEKRVNEARENLYNVRRRLEDILYNANLSVNKGTDPEKLARINNIIMELEKSVINLGSAISESDESENVELTEEQIAELKAAREEKIESKKKQ